MHIVDSHCHASPFWFEPIEPLLVQMDLNGVKQAVLVQLLNWTDNTYLFDCAERYPGRFAIVAGVDTNSSEAVARLEQAAGAGASGVRFTASTRSQGSDPVAIWRAAEELNLVVSCLGKSSDFGSAEFRSLVTEFPRLPIVIEHLGHAELSPDRDPSVRDVDYSRVLELADYPNTYIKIPGLGEFCTRTREPGPFPFERPIPPILKQVLDVFGPERMMWASDYPPVSSREGYSNALKLLRQEFDSLNEDDLGLVFGGTAMSLFRIIS